MTEVTYEKRKNEMHIRCNGHSGYGSAGNDIVCAGVSTLMFTLANAIAPERIRMTVNEEKAYLDIVINSADKGEQSVFAAVVGGMQLLENSYPKFVKIRRVIGGGTKQKKVI